MKKMLLFGFALLPLLLLSCHQGSEPLNQNDFNVISTQQEIDMGNKFATQIEESLHIYNSPVLQHYVDSIGQAIVRINDRKDIPTWTFKVIDDRATVNAFSLPGGHIYVYTGLMRLLKNEAQLAAVVGHEIGHVSARHSAEQLSKSYGVSVITSFILGDSSSALDTLLANVVTTGVFLKYSRDNELEADSLGTWYADSAGWNPDSGMIGTLNVLDSISQGSILPAFLSDHPAPADRIAAVRRQLALPRYIPFIGTALNRDRYLGMISGL